MEREREGGGDGDCGLSSDKQAVQKRKPIIFHSFIRSFIRSFHRFTICQRRLFTHES